MADCILKMADITKKFSGIRALDCVNLMIERGEIHALCGENGAGDSDIMMTDTINPLKSKFKGFHKTFKQDDLGLSLSSFLLN
ncbi:TPA: hypothetical protein OOH23_002057 [Enterococcus faecium]|nr:hypothetical protein [Enterococcus faecium]HAZ5015409.1 hypothetical protein [Enterococcus faecium]HBB8166958.1 hypothetical protein [Enterococcus faecium]HBC2453806.1 hypothetical protein [Enterococcus faecium]HBH5664205.1 hypothetical protein [Enterococcus faecium]